MLYIFNILFFFFDDMLDIMYCYIFVYDIWRGKCLKFIKYI